MPRFPTPWSKKRGARSLVDSLSSIAGEVAFFAFLFLIGVFGFSLVMINRFAPVRITNVPTEALSTSLSVWVFGILSLAAMITGAGGVILRLMREGASSERRSAMANRTRAIESGVNDASRPAFDDVEEKLPNVPSGSSLNDSPGERQRYRLAAEMSDKGLIGSTTLALLWNAVWLVLLAVVISGYTHQQPRPVLAAVLLPFGAIGIWSFRYFLAQLRQHNGVGPTIVEISNHPLFPGERYRLFVSQTGRLRLKRLTVQLTCEEETFYRQGTDLRVEKHEAMSEILCREREVVVDPQAPWEQQLQLDLPENAMHSFVSAHNAIRWKIIVRGESEPWPSFCRRFPVVVHPPGPQPKRSPR